MPLGGFRQGLPRELFTLSADNALVAVKRERKQSQELGVYHLAHPAAPRLITAWPERDAHWVSRSIQVSTWVSITLVKYGRYP